MKFGIYRLREPLDDTELAELERSIGQPLAIISCYRAWNRCRIEDDLPWLASLENSSREILLTWEPWCLPASTDYPETQPEFALNRLLSGAYDGYIRDFARRLASFPQTIYFRPMHEMNGLWYPWCGTRNGNSPAQYVDVWHHLRRLFHSEGATELKWVWSPYAFSYPETQENGMAAYFPGDDAIDWVGLDGYNWGSSRPGGMWQSFPALFSSGYKTICDLSSHPVMIAETASSELGGNKAAWIREMFAALPVQFPRISSLVWFDIHKECDWRIESSAASLAAFHAG